ncbi:neural Wiskott-Aldrich syndrome protein-like [Clupea harengus]|uniref:Neural Wiskott-Aldrich syndrome protein-like n=1 Tax=Clupea harengus TaxID=7950 RepID=A0A6P8GIG4_CLUHA|nr:neural Wiskott-Aldrich syndrome protein-like [Clupea harengus]
MSGHPPPRRPPSVGSILLTPQENDSLFNHLGRKCSTLASGVVQVFAGERNGCWVKKCCGVACLVKDNPQRSYYIRVVDVKEGKTLFEQELYNNFTVTPSRTYFLTFPGDSCQIGLNFASEEEAKRFRNTTTDLLSRRQRKTEKRRDPPNGTFLITCLHFISFSVIFFWVELFLILLNSPGRFRKSQSHPHFKMN